MKIISFWIAEIFLRYKWKGWSIRRQNEESKTIKWGFSKMQVEDCLLNGKDYFVFCRKWISCIWSHIQTWKEKQTCLTFMRHLFHIRQIWVFSTKYQMIGRCAVWKAMWYSVVVRIGNLNHLIPNTCFFTKTKNWCAGSVSIFRLWSQRSIL